MRANERTTRRIAVLMAAGVLALAGASLADARPGGGRDGGDGGRRGRAVRGIDPACASECGARECVAAAHDDFVACTESTCPTEAAAVEAACADDRRSDACKEARQALRTCAAPCRDALQSAREACRAESTACLAECPRIDAEGKDRACVRDCVADARECLAPAHDALKECRSGCAELKEAARAACAEDRDSEACTSARAALRSCVEACVEPFEDAASECFAGTQACVAACPEAATE